MPSVGVTLAFVAIWIVQGFGFVHLFAPGAKTRPLLHLVLAAACGLATNLLISATLYFAIPGITIGQLAWPVTAVLAVASLALTVARGRPQFAFDLHTAIVGLCVLVAVVLVLRPLVDQSHLGFFESFNGEFANYAAMADATQFHDSTLQNGSFPMQSREGIAGISLATMAVIMHTPAIWLVEPFSAALAAVAFTSIGVLLLQLLERRQAGKLATAIVGVVYVSLIWSAATTFFWTASFVSQFLALAIWIPTLLLQCERPDDDRATIVTLGIALGALLIVYWEMFLPNVAMLGAFHLARARHGRRFRAAVSFVIALVIGLVVAHRFGLEFARKSTTVSTAGWNVYGEHRPVLRFAANLLGFTSAYHEPAPFSPGLVVLALVGFAAAALYGLVRAWREPDGVVRGAMHLGYLFWIGLALAFALVIKRGGNNYVAAKVFLEFGWLAYVALAVAAIDCTHWTVQRGRKLAAIPVVFALLLFGNIARGAWRFARIQHRAPLYLQNEGEALRDQLHGRRPFVAGEQYSTEIIGRFFVYEQDLFAVDTAWPGLRATTFVPGAPLVLVGDVRPSSIAGVTGNFVPSWWIGNLVLLEAR